MSSHPTPPLPNIQDLPTWMRRAMRRNDYGALLTLGFCLLVAWFFIVGPNLPDAPAIENQLFITETTAQAILEGRLYPRWSPHALSGFGAPFPNFFPPGAALLTAYIHLLFAGEASIAIRYSFLLAYALAGWGTYSFVTRQEGAAAGILAAVVYVTSPYVGLIVPHLLGNLPIALGLGLLPMLLWAADRLICQNYPQDALWVALAVVLLILTHPPMALLGAVLVLALYGWKRWLQLTTASLIALIAALSAGVLLASFYTLPALLERPITWARFIPTERPLFLNLNGLFAPFRQVDPSAAIPRVTLTLGLLRWGIAALGLLRLILDRQWRTFGGFALIVTVTLCAVALYGFPSQHGLLGGISFGVACLSARALALRNRLGWVGQRLVLVCALLVVLGASAPAWLPPAPLPKAVPLDLSPLGQVLYEERHYGIATVPPGWSYPTPMTDGNPLPASDRTLRLSYGQGSINRIADETPGSAEISTLREASHEKAYQVSTPDPTQLTLLLANFAGWRASLNGNPLQVGVDPQSQHIQVALPEILRGELRVWLGSTPPRLWGWGMSGVVLLLLLGWTRRRAQVTAERYHETALLTIPETRLLVAVWGFTALVVLFTASPNATFSARALAGNDLVNATLIGSRTDAGLNLLAMRLAQSRLRAGDTLELTLYWNTLLPLETLYNVQVMLYSETVSTRLAKAVVRYPGGYPTTRWGIGRYVADTHWIEIPADLPADRYLIAVSLEVCPEDRDCDITRRPTFFEATGEFAGRQYVLPNGIEVR